MGQYDAASPKRHRGWTNNVHFSRLDLGVFKKKDMPKPRDKPVRKYLKDDGTTGYCGTKALKATQSTPQMPLKFF